MLGTSGTQKNTSALREIMTYVAIIAAAIGSISTIAPIPAVPFIQAAVPIISWIAVVIAFVANQILARQTN